MWIEVLSAGGQAIYILIWDGCNCVYLLAIITRILLRIEDNAETLSL